jgi:hypothetical protein
MSGFTTTSSVPEGTHGPHSGRVANAVDPRVDSDVDNRAAPRSTGVPAGTTGATGGLAGSNYTTAPGGTTTGFGSTGGPAPGTDGPHKSDMLNKVDPRVDSDRDYSKNLGLNPSGTADPSRQGASQGAYRDTVPSVGGVAAGGVGGTHNTTTGSHVGTAGSSNIPEGSFGPHGNRAANAVDPRVDSDLDKNRHTGTTGTTGTSALHSGTSTGTSHTTGPTGTTGSSNLTGAIASSTGPAPNTAGPHKSDLLNKMDPRVDSNLDGSKTVGGDKTFSGAGPTV